MIILQTFGIKILISYFLDMTILFNDKEYPLRFLIYLKNKNCYTKFILGA